MARKPKFEDEAKTKPGGRRRGEAVSTPPTVRGGAASAKKQRSEAPTEPPPPPDDEGPSVSIPPHKTKISGVRPKRSSGTRAATVDEVTADMSKDPRRENDD